MKMRKGWIVTWPDGTQWLGDCDRWAQEGARAGYAATRTMIMGKRRPCTACVLNCH